ncbi:MAG TPA: carbamoyltransferase C-terminal domain-containing protein [Xanthobacteraceae bacterium]|nr:carbamoyltransferase C-terminal domain-containing protein [Xanthobacteraceae bacterium]
MRILAFHPGAHDSSAAVFDDYRLLAAVQEERLTRLKGSGDGIPWLAIDEVLRIAGWTRRDVDAIASTRAFYPTIFLRPSLFKEIDYAVRRWRGKEPGLREMWRECQRRGTADTSAIFAAARFLDVNGFRSDTRFHFGNHHAAHALPALFFTDWQDALVFTADGIGDNVSYSIRTLKNGALDCHFGDDRDLLRALKANSIGQAYSFATALCGFRKLRHEGKLTGLAAYGEPTLAPAIAQRFCVDVDGLIATDFRGEVEIGDAMGRICKGASRETIAASIQKATEDLMLAAVRHWIDRHKVRHLGLGGGLFANVRLNRLLAESLPLDEVFVFPAMGDDGLCVGAALSFLLGRDGLTTWLGKRYRLDTVYLGRDFDRDIDAALGSAGLRRQSEAPTAGAVARIAAGQVGAAYLGRMEFGPRALGARSIIASPADHAINDDLNHRLERSEFMPFAPYVLDEDADKVFEITPVNRYAARFMTITCGVRPEWRDKIPAVVHVDGTARPQIVRERENPLYAAILRGFRDATGLPVLVNTSFNVHEEPIVNAPTECARALADGRIDFVVTEQAIYTR